MTQYKSEVKTWSSSGGDQYFFDWIPREGPNGGRNMIDGFQLVVDGQVDVTTAVIQGEDLARMWGRILVEQTDGVKRWNLPGDASRVMSYLLAGPDKYSEHADVAASTNQAADPTLWIPMAKPYTRDPQDFALPVDMFKHLVITNMPSTDLNIGTSVVTVDSISYYVIAEVHEELEVRIPCVDEIAMTELTTATEGRLSINGKLHDLTLHARGASGGASLANLTDVRIDELAMPPFTRVPDLEAAYRRSRNIGSNSNATIGNEVYSDPHVTDQAAAVLVADEETSFYEGPVLSSVKLNLTNSVASLRAIHRTIIPASQTHRARVSAAYGLQPANFRVKTAAKSKQHPKDWPEELRPFLPLKAPLLRNRAVRAG